MSGPLLWNNFGAYSLQIGLLIGVAGWLPAALRMRPPKARLMFWHALLAGCLLIPLLQPWKSEAITAVVQVSDGAAILVAPSAASGSWHITPGQIALAVLMAGCAVRLGLLVTGFWRLRRYRRNSIPLDPSPAWAVEADLRLSSEIASPVTFGFRKPVVLLPADFPEFDAGLQDAILCHEILHVRRHDWLAMLMEELVRAGLWFHPAIWWLLGEIQLAREQTVDRAAIDVTKAREQYVDALLAVAGVAVQLDLAPAPLFLRKRHLKQRVISILKETRMSKTKNVFTLAVGLAMLAGAGWFATAAFPLWAAPQTVADAAGVSVQAQGARFMHRAPVTYPRGAQMQGIEGTVVAQVTLDGNGNVSDASILSGPEPLRKVVLQSLLSWHFTKDAAGSTRQIAVTFRLPNPTEPPARGVQGSVVGGILSSVPAGAPRASALTPSAAPSSSASDSKRIIRSINVSGLDLPAEEVLARLPLHVNDEWRPELMPKLVEAAHEIDEHLSVSAVQIPPNGIALRISAPGSPMVANVVKAPPTFPGAVPVEGGSQNAKLISHPDPVYPEIAKSARIQGTVEFAALIGADGHMKELQVVSGHPLLRQAAIEAVKQWVYQPTLLNGNPVAVSTTIQVTFSLSQ